MNRIGIRREDKHRFEARAPLTPDDVRTLVQEHGLEVVVQESPIRAFPAEAYQAAGARVAPDLADCPVILGVKEIPPHLFEPGKTYVFFSHIIKGQAYNMPMLRQAMTLGCSIIDYEKVTDDAGRRLIFFGRHAGLAGMIDTLWALGRRLEWEGLDTPFATLKPAWKYPNLAAAKEAVAEVGRRIRQQALPESLQPLVIGFTGYGNVSQGAQEVLDCLEPTSIEPADLPQIRDAHRDTAHTVFKVVFEERHMVVPADPDGTFDLQEYYQHPERYRGVFEQQHLPHLSVLVNCIYWDERYPRLLTKEYLARTQAAGNRKLKVVGDISCDIEGAVEATVKPTDPGNPVYVYDPVTDTAHDGVEGDGPVILAVDTLPCELPVDATEHFGRSLLPYVPALARADFSVPFDRLELPPEIKRAVLVYQGQFTPEYTYIGQYL